MSIRFDLDAPRNLAFGELAEERERCALIVEGTPLGYRNDAEWEVLERFADRVVAMIRAGVPAKKSID